MLATGSRTVSRRLTNIVPSLPPPTKALCPVCVRARARAYASASKLRGTRQKVKKVSSEFSSRNDQFSVSRRSGPDDSLDSVSKAASESDHNLQRAFEELFDPVTSSSSTTLDARQVIDVVYPLIFRRKLRDLLDPHVGQIATTIFRYAETTRSERLDPEDQRRITTILGHCYLRSASRPLSLNNGADGIASKYASYLIKESTNGDDNGYLRVSLQSLKSILERLQKDGGPPGYQIPPSIAAAYAVLRYETQSTAESDEPPSGVSLNHLNRMDLATALDAYLTPLGQSSADYAEAISLLFDQTSSGPAVATTNLPTSKKDLQAEIASLRSKGDVIGVVSLWKQIRASLSGASLDDAASMCGEEELAAFLRVFKRPPPGGSLIARIGELETHAQEVLAMCPKPLPRAVASTLLALRARPDDAALATGDEVSSLDSVHTPSTRANPVEMLENLHAVWKSTGERDVKMYMMYMEGLGLFGDLPGLQRAWNELIRDARCKELYLAEDAEGLNTSYPPTHALNHMISAALLIPTTGPPVALDLFEQASRANSSIPINLITINTVLRHHARQADLQAMTGLFALAEQRNLKPDVVTYTTLLQGLLRAGQLDMAKRALGTMHSQGISPNERTCSMLIADLAKSGDQKGLQHAEELLKLMRQMGMKTNEVTWTGLIAGYFRGGWEEDGWDAVARMERHGHKLNRVGYNVLFRQSEGRGETGTRLWQRMIRQGLKPNSDSYLLILAPLIKQERWEEADHILEQMDRQCFRPEKAALARLVDNVKRRRRS